MVRQISFWFLAGTIGFVVACGRAQDRKPNMESMSPAASTPGGAAATADAVDVSFKTQPDPLQVGENTFETMLMANRQPVTDADVSLELLMPAMPSMNMPEMRNTVALKHEGSGRYAGAGKVGMAGRWNATVTVRRAAKVVASRTFDVTAK